MASRQVEENYGLRDVRDRGLQRDGALKAIAGQIQKLSYREMKDLVQVLADHRLCVENGETADALIRACDVILERPRA